MWLLESRVCLAEKQPSRNRTKAELWRSGVPAPGPTQTWKQRRQLIHTSVAIHRIGVFRALSGAF